MKRFRKKTCKKHQNILNFLRKHEKPTKKLYFDCIVHQNMPHFVGENLLHFHRLHNWWLVVKANGSRNEFWSTKTDWILKRGEKLSDTSSGKLIKLKTLLRTLCNPQRCEELKFRRSSLRMPLPRSLRPTLIKNIFRPFKKILSFCRRIRRLHPWQCIAFQCLGEWQREFFQFCGIFHPPGNSHTFSWAYSEASVSYGNV